MSITKQNINRTAISKATGLDLGHISRIFSGKAKPSMKSAKLIAEYLDISLDELYNLITE